MFQKIYLFITLLLAISFSGCGEIETSTPTPIQSPTATPSSAPSNNESNQTKGTLSLSGTITYERVLATHSGGISRLDFSKLKVEKAKQVNVKLINENNNVVDSVFTDDTGKYIFNNLPKKTKYKVRVYARILKQNAWDVRVIDNTHGDAVYVLEGSMASTGTTNTRRNLKALASTHSSPPFAILGSLYMAIQKVNTVDSNANFPELKINWSVNNIETGTYYDGTNNIFILGDQKGDSDEYDDHIIIHEWGHFFEAKFSRADNIGGQHGTGNYLDMRVAFGEGFGNAISAIVTDDPIYFDTSGRTGWNMDIESASQNTPGWFSEASVQRILYDLYDADNDKADTLALGFKPLYDVLVGKQKKTEAFTSIFSFIHALKKENSDVAVEIDDIVSSENIAQITDIYGENRKLLNNDTHTLPLYRSLDMGGQINVCTSNKYGTWGYNNKLNHHKYIKFTVASSGNYTIKVEQSNNRYANPDFVLFKTSPFENIIRSETKGSEEETLTLKKGSYLIDVSDANVEKVACFDVSIN